MSSLTQPLLHQLLRRFLGFSHRLADSREQALLPRRSTAIAPNYPITPPATLPVIDLELGARLAGGKEHLAREQLKRLIDSLAEKLMAKEEVMQMALKIVQRERQTPPRSIPVV